MGDYDKAKFLGNQKGISFDVIVKRLLCFGEDVKTDVSTTVKPLGIYMNPLEILVRSRHTDVVQNIYNSAIELVSQGPYNHARYTSTDSSQTYKDKSIQKIKDTITSSGAYTTSDKIIRNYHENRYRFKLHLDMYGIEVLPMELAIVCMMFSDGGEPRTRAPITSSDFDVLALFTANPLAYDGMQTFLYNAKKKATRATCNIGSAMEFMRAGDQGTSALSSAQWDIFFRMTLPEFANLRAGHTLLTTDIAVLRDFFDIANDVKTPTTDEFIKAANLDQYVAAMDAPNKRVRCPTANDLLAILAFVLIYHADLFSNQKEASKLNTMFDSDVLKCFRQYVERSNALSVIRNEQTKQDISSIGDMFVIDIGNADFLRECAFVCRSKRHPLC